MHVAEILATVMGLIQGALVWADQRANWIFYCLQYVCMAIFSLNARLYGDVTNCAVYFAVGVVGWFLWGRGREMPIRRCSPRERGIYVLILVALTAVLYPILHRTEDPLPLLDALTTAGGYLATYYMLTKKVDAWALWFAVDILYVVEYYLLPDRAWYLIGLNLIWTVMAVGSFISWNRKSREEQV